MVVESRRAKRYSKKTRNAESTMLSQIRREHRTKYNFIRNKTKKVVVRVIRMKAEKEIDALSESLKQTFRFLKMMKRWKRCRR